MLGKRMGRVAFAASCGLSLSLVMCGGDDDGGGGSASPDGSTSADGSTSNPDGNTSGSDGSNVPDAARGAIRPKLASSRALPTIDRIVASPGGGWTLLTDHVGIAAMVDTLSLQTGGPNVLALDAQHKAKWVKGIKQGSGGQSGPPRICIDENGNTYVAGLTYATTIDFGDGVTVATGGSNTQVGYIGQIDASGVAKWVRLVYASQGVGDIACSAKNGRVAVGGWFFPYNPLRYLALTDAGNGYVSAPNTFRESERAGYVLMLSATDGLGEWVGLYSAERTNSFISTGAITSVAIDSAGDVTATGNFNGDVLKDKALNVIATSTSAGYILKVGSGATMKWIRPFPGASSRAVASDATRVVTTGSFTGTVDFGKGARTGPGVYALAIDPATGNTIADKTFGKGGEPQSIALDSSGGTAIHINMQALAAGDVDGIPLPTAPASYVVALAPNVGTSKWLEPFANPQGGGDVRLQGIAIDASGTTAFTGDLTKAYDFGAGQLPGPGGFLATYSP